MSNYMEQVCLANVKNIFTRCTYNLHKYHMLQHGMRIQNITTHAHL